MNPIAALQGVGIACATLATVSYFVSGQPMLGGVWAGMVLFQVATAVVVYRRLR